MRTVVHSILVWFSFVTATHAGKSDSPIVTPKFLGAQSCASSGCHGGAGELSKQFTVWSQYDFHHQRPYATLETARSERLAEVLKIGKATESPRCTVCHAPFQTVPPERLAKEAKVTEGVSCESCHGSAENWLRSHTRKDYTHQDRVASGMRDLKNLYVRANTCVACHQNVDRDILAAGHPELIFELDGQCVTMPKHWREATNWNGAQAWLIGQAVALREMSWQLMEKERRLPGDYYQPPFANTNLVNQHAGLSRILSPLREERSPGRFRFDFSHTRDWADALGRKVASMTWSDQLTREHLTRLANLGDLFLNIEVPLPMHAYAAERLVLGLDRLILALPATKTDAVNAALNQLFADAQSVPDFDPNRFAKDLKEFHSRVSGTLESK